MFRLAWYRLLLKLHIHPVLKQQHPLPHGPYYRFEEIKNSSGLDTEDSWDCELNYFSHHKELNQNNLPPNWHRNFINGRVSRQSETHWWEIPDFDIELGDIKTIWELSRFEWLVSLAQSASKGDKETCDRMNAWLSDWCLHNKPYLGINWKCGQEASIRVIHLALAAHILKQIESPERGLISLLEMHIKRIYPTISYAIAQNNNHGTSEAAALFIGGSWLANQGVAMGDHWMNVGRKWLEERARTLIEQDGSFSQYSVNYHRLMLDTYSFAESWRRQLKLEPFSQRLTSALSRATNWLFQLTQPGNGLTPNLGANDGAYLLPLGKTKYSDYRPSVQLASVLFNQANAYTDNEETNQLIRWLQIEKPVNDHLSLQSSHFNNGGYFVLHNRMASAILRYPKFKFRPGQSDALHVDFWIDGVNILRDSGTYSYHVDTEIMAKFTDVEGHNTIQFDDRNQMPRLGRFMLGRWLKTSQLQELNVLGERQSCGAGYRDSYGVSHNRTMTLTAKELIVEDNLYGFNHKAVLRWRLLPGQWQIDGQSVINSRVRIQVESSVTLKRFEIVEGEESLYYLDKTNIPVLEVEVDKPGRITTVCIYG